MSLVIRIKFGSEFSGRADPPPSSKSSSLFISDLFVNVLRFRVLCDVPEGAFDKLLFLGIQEPSSRTATDKFLKLLMSQEDISPQLDLRLSQVWGGYCSVVNEYRFGQGGSRVRYSWSGISQSCEGGLWMPISPSAEPRYSHKTAYLMFVSVLVSKMTFCLLSLFGFETLTFCTVYSLLTTSCLEIINIQLCYAKIEIL